MNRTPLALTPIVAVLICCSSFSGAQSTGADAGADAATTDAAACNGADLTSDPANCGACAHACSIQQYCNASICEQGCPGKIVYVSNDGNDDSTGCTLQTPKKTIASAITFIGGTGAVGHAIHACHGTYVEPGLTLDAAVSLQGGYDCSTGERPADYGFPTFDPNSLTTIAGTQVTDPTVTATTLAIKIPTSDGGTAPPITIDGIRVTGPTTGTTLNSQAVSILGTAPVTLTNMWVTGGATTGTGLFGSCGIAYGAGASPEIALSTIDGGTGTSNVLADEYGGSIGIFAGDAAGAGYIHDSIIRGGAGTATSLPSSVAYYRHGGGSAGITFQLSKNQIQSGGGKTGTGVSNVGVIFGGAFDARMTDNIIEGLPTTCTGSNYSASGILLGPTSGSVEIRNNRIYGGDLIGTGSAYFYAINVSGGTNVDISQNMLHPGDAALTAPASGAGLDTIAIFADVSAPTSAVTIRQNTIVEFTHGGTEATSGIEIGASTTPPSIPPAVSIENNLFVATDHSLFSTGILDTYCNDITAFAGNAFVNVQNVLGIYPIVAGNGCGSSFDYFTDITTTMSRLATDTAPASPNTQNILLAPYSGSCSLPDSSASPARCAEPTNCTTATMCATTIFGSLSLATLTGPTGFALSPTAPCLITKGGIDLSATFPTDIFGTARTPPLSIGAFQSSSGSCAQ